MTKAAMTGDEAIASAIRAGCTAADLHIQCSYPDCTCRNTPKIVRAAIAECCRTTPELAKNAAATARAALALTMTNQTADSAPRRIQRKRTKGWRMPPNTVSVTRPGKWGNPYYVGMFRKYNHADAVADYRRWLEGDYGARVWAGPPPTTEAIRQVLRGKNLACFCPLSSPCHADVLLEIANR